jgi:hypothetical protein
MTERLDVFTNVHQGIRRALFEASTALARAPGDPEAESAALELVDDALLFVTRHGENEDALLLPLLDARAPDVAARMRDAHHRIEAELDALRALRARAAPELYLCLSLFIAHYLEHMYEEEVDLEPHIRAVISDSELAVEGQRAVARVDASERIRMLRLMLPALPIAAARLMLERMPEGVAQQLAGIDARVLTSER